MLHIVYILASSYPQILWFLCTCFYPCILVSLCLCVLAFIFSSSHPLTLRFMYSGCLLVSLHPHIIISSGSCVFTCIPAFSYSQVRVCLLVSSYPHIFLPLGSCTLGVYWYLRILTSSYP